MVARSHGISKTLAERVRYSAKIGLLRKKSDEKKTVIVGTPAGGMECFFMGTAVLIQVWLVRLRHTLRFECRLRLLAYPALIL